MTLTRNDCLERIHHHSQIRPRPVTLGQLFEFGSDPSQENLLQGAQFLHQELPIRLAHRIRELENLPSGLSEMPSVLLVRRMYTDSFRDLSEFPRPKDAEDDARYTRLLEEIKDRHNNVVSIVARGVIELKARYGEEAMDAQIHEFLDRFHMSRIGIRMLIGQHLALHRKPNTGQVGLISERCSPVAIAREAIEDAAHLCRINLGAAPEVGLYGNLELTFTYVPSHLHHMLFELLKNSMRAVVEVHSAKGRPLPGIRIATAEGSEDVTIKISDEGGGIPRSGIPKIWTYLYSTAPAPRFDPCTPYFSDFEAPFAGYGYGLPISRLYSRYFGGDLQVLAMEGYGTDAYLHLRRLGNTREALR